MNKPSEEAWAKAGEIAAREVGFDDEPCWDSFSVEVDDFEFGAELDELHGSGVGLVKVNFEEECRLFDEDGFEEEVSE